ncbi:MAG: ribonuclease domain-containing protein [Rudaea sp.]
MKRPAWLALILLAVAWLAAGCTTAAGETAGPPDTIVPATAQSTATFVDGLPTIRTADLPAQARDTLALIRAGGPFPYRQDGIVFQNRERLLPLEPGGYYHEYTVRTPGASDRGARRIITGSGGELYYTADHYASFQRIVP